MTRKPDPKTLNLFDWKPDTGAKAFAPEITRAVDLRSLVSKVTAAALRDAEKSRDEIAEEITAYLGEEMTSNMLDAYASAARENHVISLIRFIGLLHATGDMRPLQAIAELFDWAVIPARYLPAIEESILTDKIEAMQQMQKMARKKWRGA